jgi:hypothetical protein
VPVAGRVLDFGLSEMGTCTHATLLQSPPNSFVDATPGNGNCIGIGATTFGAPYDHAGGERAVTSVAITSGTVLTSGTVNLWAVVDTNGARLLAWNQLQASGVESAGNQFSLSPLTIRVPRGG